MSKYKYTSLLSSQYRSVFKSYHSVDRYERQQALIPSVSKNKRERTFNSSLKYQLHEKNDYTLQNKSKMIDRNEGYNRLKQYLNKRTPNKGINTQPNYQHQYLSKSPQICNTQNQRLFNRIKNKYENKSGHNFKSDQIYNSQSLLNVNNNEQQLLNLFEEIPCRNPYINQNTINHKNNDFKLKVSQITKKRNDIKLKMRVNNLHQINRKYDYLNTQHNENQPFDEKYSSVNKFYDISSNFKPLHELNSNKIHLKLEKNILQNLTNKQTLEKLTDHYDEENIQTPHFCHAENKTKHCIDASTIEKKLQNFVKNTFTDRY